MRQLQIWRALFVAGVLTLALAAVALASDPSQSQADEFSCLTCHGNPGLKHEFPSGEVWQLYVDPGAFAASVHGREGLSCDACHPDVTSYPHPPISANSLREYQITQYRACATTDCHPDQYQDSLDSVHAQLIAAGDWTAPVCTDCHGSHSISPPDEPRTKIPQSCAQCHSSIYEEYLSSVHGHALVDDNNRDVPTCVDCHGVHRQEDPRSARFRLNSPNLCAECHADEEMMARYGISTRVFDTYVADFHGTTAVIFERQTPDLPTNVAVCYDCHGVHNIQSAQDPDSPIFRENLLRNCQQCHPNAADNFPTSWLSHYEPSLEKYPLVFFVEWFYKLLIPAVIGFMVVFVSVDAGSKIVRNIRGKKS